MVAKRFFTVFVVLILWNLVHASYDYGGSSSSDKCSEDSDCDSDQFCATDNDECTDLSKEGEYCDGKTTADCESGLKCDGHKCQKKCSKNKDCGKSQFCASDPDLCKDLSKEDELCDGGKNFDCKSGLTCKDHKCTTDDSNDDDKYGDYSGSDSGSSSSDKECSKDSDCDSGQFCATDDDVCKDVGKEGDYCDGKKTATCGSGLKCDGHVCRKKCSKDSDCKSSQFCATDPDECKDKSKKDELCDGKKNFACKSGLGCDAHKCYKKCSSDDDCKSDQFCKSDNDKCTDKGAKGDDCEKDSECEDDLKCDNGSCCDGGSSHSWADYSSYSQKSNSYYSSSSSSGKCSTDSDCASGKFCATDDDTCKDLSGQGGYCDGGKTAKCKDGFKCDYNQCCPVTSYNYGNYRGY